MKPNDSRLARHTPALRRFLAVSAVLTALDTAALLAQVYLLGDVLAGVVAGWGAPSVARSAGWLVAVVGFRAATTAIATMLSRRAASATSAQLRAALLARVIDDGLHQAPGEVGVLATRGVDALEPYVMGYLPTLVAAAFVPPVMLVTTLAVDRTSGLLLCITLPLVPVFMVLVGKYSSDRAERSWASLQRLAAHTADVVTGLTTLKLFGRHHAQSRVIERLGERYRRATMRTLRTAFLSAFVLELLASLSIALVAVSVGLRLVDAHVSLRTAFVVLLLAPECFAPLRRLGASYHSATEGLEAAEHIVAVLDATPEARGNAPVPARLHVRCDGISVEQRGRNIMAPRDATFAVRAGEIVALVGPNGAGKSTVLAVLRGRMTPDHGSVTIDGRALSDIDRDAWDATVAWVPQRAALGDTTAREVLTLGVPEADGTDIGDVARALDITALLDRRARTLSAGERQRLAIARAILRVEHAGARLALLDEPTSNLDVGTEALVVGAVHRLAAAGAAVVVVAHRRALVEAADRVVAVAPGARTDAPATDFATAALPAFASRSTETGSAGAVDAATPVVAPRPAPTSPLRWVWHEAGPVRGRLVASVLLAAAATLAGLALTGCAAWLLVRAAEHPPVLELGVAVVLVRAFALAKATLRYLERLASHDAALRLITRLRVRVYDRLAVIAPGGIVRARRGDLLARVVGDLDNVQDLVLRALLPPLAVAATGGALVVAGFLIAPAAGVVFALALLVGGGVLPLAARALERRAGAGAARERAALTAEAVDIAETADELAAFGAGERRLARVTEHDRRLAQLTRREARGVAFGDASEAVVAGIATAALLVVGAGLVRSGALDPRWFAALALIGWSLAEVLGTMPVAARRAAALRSAVARVTDVLDAFDPVFEPAVPAPPPTGPIGVRARGLVVRWPDARVPVLDGLDLDLAPGSRTVLVGPSGTGKSTLAAALVRFVSPEAGTLEIGGVDARRLCGDDVRRLVGWCAQDAHLFDATIADNLRIGKPDATDAELRAACRAVRLDDWVNALPDGLATGVGVGGAAVSGGEAQRLAVARELLADRPVIVLDEPTANVEPAAAAALTRDLLTAAAGRTVLLISHNSAGAEHADSVITLALGAAETRVRQDGEGLHASSFAKQSLQKPSVTLR